MFQCFPLKYGDKFGRIHLLVGGFNPPEKYQSNWMISPNRGENKKSLIETTNQIYLLKIPTTFYENIYTTSILSTHTIR